jgi:hypothetical protein
MKDIEGLTECHICPKCNNYMLSACHNKNYHKEYFEKHVEKCDGKIHANLKLDHFAKPYIPHLMKNKLFAFLYANNRVSEYRYLDEYITYDFETISKSVNEKFGKSSNQDSTLHAVSVA